MPFPPDFRWGAATASYQIEGAARQDGRGECIWTRFSRLPGKVFGGHTGDVACDHYHRFADDIKLMGELGLNAYRFSVAWPRVLPQGTGGTNDLGLDFYDRLVDGLLAAGIQPYVTLYHWDLPQALQNRGGWLNRGVVGWFSDYTDLITQRLGDRVKDWITLNEPQVVSMLGYRDGIHAPGMQDPFAAYRAAHHLMLAHGAAVPIIRNNVHNARAGITLDLTHVMAFENGHEEEVQQVDGLRNRWFLDPVTQGSYPHDSVEHLGILLRDMDPAEASTMNPDIDFLGVNYYSRHVVGKNRDPRPRTEMDWEVYPEGLYLTLKRLHDDYNIPRLYVTENGAAFTDPAPVHARIVDTARVEYLQDHFEQAERAIDEGVPLVGYFVWSLLDNFEWAEGYTKRFGIIAVDYASLRRTIKDSGYWYRDFIRDQQGE
jgi:beta-glucosidase